MVGSSLLQMNLRSGRGSTSSGAANEGHGDSARAFERDDEGAREVPPLVPHPFPPRRSWWSCWLLVRSQPLLVRRQLVPWRLWHRLSRVLPVEAPGATVGMGVVLAVLRDSPLTRTSSRPTRPRSHRRMTLWRRSTGFASWSRSFGCSE